MSQYKVWVLIKTSLKLCRFRSAVTYGFGRNQQTGDLAHTNEGGNAVRAIVNLSCPFGQALGKTGDHTTTSRRQDTGVEHWSPFRLSATQPLKRASFGLIFGFWSRFWLDSWVSAHPNPQKNQLGVIYKTAVRVEGGCPVRTKGVLQMRTSALFGVINCGFFEIYGVSARSRGKVGLSQCGHFADKEGGGQFFAILCERLLWTAPITN